MKYKLLEPHQKLISEIIKFYTAEVTNPSYFDEIKLYCTDHTILKLRHNHQVFLNMGWFSAEAFKFYAMDKKIVNGIPSPVYEIILNILSAALILFKVEPNTINNPTVLYAPNQNKEFLIFLGDNKLFFNRIFGFDYIINKYERSVVKIVVEKNGDPSIGTGFIIMGKSSQQLIVTNFHVIDNMDKIEVLNINDEIIEHKILIAEKDCDLAVLSIIKNNVICEPFILNSNFDILNQIMTVGFPPVPTSKLAYPLYHVGEINSKIETYFGSQLFLFSAKTNPGNSGGPVIDEDGLVIGIVSQLLEEQEWYKMSKLPYCGAIPSELIIAFLSKNNII